MLKYIVKKNNYIKCIQNNIITPVQLSTLDNIILNEFNIDFNNWINPNLYVDGVNTNSFDQVPDICKKYMNYNNNNWELKWNSDMIEEMLKICNNKEYDKLSPNDYPNSSLQFVTVFNKYINPCNKKCLVLGSISPWVECLLIHFNAKSVTTLDYITPECNYNKINIIKMEDYKKENKYDIIISFSSIEHDGLGRYGDPINPNGDINACKNAYNMLNDNGIFICGIPIGDGCIEGNFHRIYNKKRIDKLFCIFSKYIGCVSYPNCDEILNFSGNNWQNQPIFIYQK
jgi:ssDNA-binding Zn-finger/Zn-ribbon topoisomerase 1